jgi:hypothetical protein
MKYQSHAGPKELRLMNLRKTECSRPCKARASSIQCGAVHCEMKRERAGFLLEQQDRRGTGKSAFIPL